MGLSCSPHDASRDEKLGKKFCWSADFLSILLSSDNLLFQSESPIKMGSVIARYKKGEGVESVEGVHPRLDLNSNIFEISIDEVSQSAFYQCQVRMCSTTDRSTRMTRVLCADKYLQEGRSSNFLRAMAVRHGCAAARQILMPCGHQIG